MSSIGVGHSVNKIENSKEMPILNEKGKNETKGMSMTHVNKENQHRSNTTSRGIYTQEEAKIYQKGQYKSSTRGENKLRKDCPQHKHTDVIFQNFHAANWNIKFR